MKKDKLTYRNENRLAISLSPREYFRMHGCVSDLDICRVAVKTWMELVKCPLGTAFGSEISNETPLCIEFIIHEKYRGYAGKMVFERPSFF